MNFSQASFLSVWSHFRCCYLQFVRSSTANHSAHPSASNYHLPIRRFYSQALLMQLLSIRALHCFACLPCEQTIFTTAIYHSRAYFLPAYCPLTTRSPQYHLSAYFPPTGSPLTYCPAASGPSLSRPPRPWADNAHYPSTVRPTWRYIFFSSAGPTFVFAICRYDLHPTGRINCKNSHSNHLFNFHQNSLSIFSASPLTSDV